MGIFIGGPSSEIGTPIHVDDAVNHIFGFTLLNDWSAREILFYELGSFLGPFGSKNLATTIR